MAEKLESGAGIKLVIIGISRTQGKELFGGTRLIKITTSG